MDQRETKFKWCSLAILLFCLGVEPLKTPATPDSSAKKPIPIKVREATIAELEEDLEKVKKQITANCTSLRNSIVSANSETEVLGYNQNTLDGGFDGSCTSDGTLIWTSKSVIDSADPEKTIDDTSVKAVATELQASRTVEDGVVELITEPASIEVTFKGAMEKRLEWDLDLRKRKHAIGFVSALKELGANLKQQQGLEKKLADELAALDAQRPKPKTERRVKKRR